MTSKNLLSYIFLTSLIVITMSCSSGDKPAEGDQAANPEVAEAVSESTDAAVADTPVEEAPPADIGSDDFASTNEPAAPADEAVQTEAAQDMNALQDQTNPDMATTDTAPAPEQANSDMAQTDSATTDQSVMAEPAPTDTAAADQQQGDLFGGAVASNDNAAAPAEEAPPKKMLSLAHIKSKPFKKAGMLLNTVYIAREGDTVESVSEKLFGENKIKELKKANPRLKKGMKTGEKVYFNSPNRPDDNEKMMVVYEDQGLPPTSYTTREGDTLKALAMEWYGTEASYKEIYAINRNVSSTTDLPAGTELQYWPASASVVAYNAPKAAEPEPEPVAEVPPPPPMPEAPAPAAVAAVPAASPAPVAGTMDSGTMPPPPPDLNAPTLPPPPAAISKRRPPADAMDKDTIMYAVAAGVLLVGGGALVAIRRKNAKRNSGVTQI